MTTTYLLTIAVAVLAGLIVSRPAKKLQLPAVTAYLIAGILIGPYALGALGVDGLGFTSSELIDSLDILSDCALGFIAFAIGNEFRLSQLKKTGRQATVIGICQALAAALLVDIVLIVVHFIFPDKLSLSAAIVLGAIATATAPAATLMVVRQYKAHGPLTDLLLPIVALDDAVGLVVFAISMGIAKAIDSGTVDAVSIIVNPIIEIAASLALGAAMGAILTYIERFFHSRSKRMSICIAFVLLTVGLSMLEIEIGAVTLSFSSLLVCMMLGTVFCNLCDFSEELMERTDGWTTPLFIFFFVISGASLDFSVLSDVTIILIGIVFILTRAAGKISGTYLSAKAVGCSPDICKYLGITLLPQAGVALGMTITAGEELGSADAAVIRSIVLFSILILELVGPMLTKMSLLRVGEIEPDKRTSARGVLPGNRKG
ncbi:MAG: cation:proton antiporter [Clostridia bacterium]|nr:cation:proton antiporter [Clostridia bacterium]